MDPLDILTGHFQGEQLAKLGQANAMQGMYRRPTVREQLEQRKLIAEAQLAQINEALSALDANPGFEGAFDAITKAL